jgi:hypothetical protein
MTNFILIDAPDFVLLAASNQRTTRLPPGRPLYFNRALSDLVRLLGALDAEADCSSELRFEGPSHRSMRRILERYGFDLPPLDIGELYGMLD